MTGGYFPCLEPLDLKTLTEMCIWHFPNQTDQKDFPSLVLFSHFPTHLPY